MKVLMLIDIIDDFDRNDWDDEADYLDAVADEEQGIIDTLESVDMTEVIRRELVAQATSSMVKVSIHDVIDLRDPVDRRMKPVVEVTKYGVLRQVV